MIPHYFDIFTVRSLQVKNKLIFHLKIKGGKENSLWTAWIAKAFPLFWNNQIAPDETYIVYTMIKEYVWTLYR